MKLTKTFLLESTVLNEIPINIWDDYVDDESIQKKTYNPNIQDDISKMPMGEGQDTYAYVESFDISLDVEKEALSLLGSFMNANNCKTELVKNKKENEAGWRYELKIYSLTHKKRKEIVADLKKANLKVDGVPLRIYSES